MAPKKRGNVESSAIVTRASSRTGKPKLDAHSDPQPPTVVTRTSSRKLDSDSGTQQPKSNKAKTNASGASSSKKRNGESSAIVTQSSTHQRGKAETNTCDDGGVSSSAMATRRSNRLLNSPLGVAQKPKFKKPPKKMANMESSSPAVVTRSAKRDKAKLESKFPSANTSDAVKKRGNGVSSSRCEKGNAQSSSGVVTRRRATMNPRADPQPPKSNKAKRKTSTSRRGKAKIHSDPTPPAEPEPPKPKPRGKTSTYARVSKSAKSLN